MASASYAPATSPTRSPVAEDRVRGLTLVVGMVVVMWVLEVVDALGAHLDDDGIHPRDVDGLPGIVSAPFLHAGFAHLIGNTIPFLILGFTIALGGLARTAAVTAIVALVAGLGTWVFAPAHTNHIGASGVVFGFATYLVARGVFSRRPLHLVVGLAVLAVYGTTLLFGLVPTPGISWQGHLFGAIGGVVAARAIHATTRRASPAAS
jgi:membrane associated rhomboid family serine protease